MTGLDDLDLRSDEPEPEGSTPPEPRPPLGLLVGLAVLLAVGAGLAFWLLRRPAPGPPQPLPTAPPIAGSPTPAPTPLDLPELDGSDPLVRQLALGLSSDPRFAAWLATPGLVRTLAAAAVNVADGVSPVPHLRFLAPPGPFTVVKRGASLAIDPASYARYDTLTDVVTSVDPSACARVFGQLEPLFERAYRELGYPRGGFRDALSNAAAQLLEVPTVAGDVMVRPVMRASLVYELEDPRLESLSPAQKHVLRTGPANVRRIHAWLREFREALSAPPAAVPAPSEPR
jgi:hypothetical protein